MFIYSRVRPHIFQSSAFIKPRDKFGDKFIEENMHQNDPYTNRSCMAGLAKMASPSEMNGKRRKPRTMPATPRLAQQSIPTSLARRRANEKHGMHSFSVMTSGSLRSGTVVWWCARDVRVHTRHDTHASMRMHMLRGWEGRGG